MAGNQLVEVSEAWSTKLCSCCGALNDPGNSATYTCSDCHVKMNRDENGARYIRNLLYVGAFSFSQLVECHGYLANSTVRRNPVMGQHLQRLGYSVFFFFLIFDCQQ